MNIRKAVILGILVAVCGAAGYRLTSESDSVDVSAVTQEPGESELVAGAQLVASVGESGGHVYAMDWDAQGRLWFIVSRATGLEVSRISPDGGGALSVRSPILEC
jgi:hypothetical protein